MALYLTAKVFIATKLVASITWHLYYLTIYQQTVDNFWLQASLMTVISTTVFYLFYQQNRKMSLEELNKIIEKRNVWVAIFTSLSIFVLSNISFILSGILLLLTQGSQQYDRYLRQELSSIYDIFQLQYKQYNPIGNIAS